MKQGLDAVNGSLDAVLASVVLMGMLIISLTLPESRYLHASMLCKAAVCWHFLLHSFNALNIGCTRL